MNPNTIRDLKAGQSARIISIWAVGEMGRRIREMGLTPGTDITVTGRAPLKDPVALKVGGSTLTLRNNEADQIVVQPQN